MSTIVDRVITDKLSIGSTYENIITSNVSSDITLTLPGTTPFNKACLTTNGLGTSGWNYAQNSATASLFTNMNLPTSTSAAPYLSTYATTPSLVVSKVNANGNDIFKNRYLKSTVSTIGTTSFSELVYSTYMNISTIKSGAGSNLSTKLLNNGCPIISYVDSSTSFVTIGICSSDDGTGAWYFETVDATSISIGTSICILANGCPAVAYLDTTTTNLMLAVNSRQDGLGTWTISSIEATGAILSTVNNVSMCVSATGLPMIAYYYSNTTELRIAVNSNIDGSGSWTITTVDSTNDTGISPSITLLLNGCPIIAYIYNTGPSLKVAVCSTLDGSSGWTLTTITSSIVNSSVSICILANGLPIISYFDILLSTVIIKTAYNTLPNGLGTWNISGAIYNGSVLSSYTSIGVTSVGIPYVMYQRGPAVYLSYNSTIDSLGSWSFAGLEINNAISSSTLSLNNGYPMLFYYIPSNGNLRMVINPFKNSFYFFNALTTYQLNGLVKN
jgi:hypothetical protein